MFTLSNAKVPRASVRGSRGCGLSHPAVFIEDKDFEITIVSVLCFNVDTSVRTHEWQRRQKEFPCKYRVHRKGRASWYYQGQIVGSGMRIGENVCFVSLPEDEKSDNGASESDEKSTISSNAAIISSNFVSAPEEDSGISDAQFEARMLVHCC